MTDWPADRSRIAEIASLIDAAGPSDIDHVVALANEAQVDLLQVKWRARESRGGPPRAEWSGAYRSISAALIRFNRRVVSWEIARQTDSVVAGSLAVQACLGEALARPCTRNTDPC